jgi:hypothetical protein
MVYGVLIEIQQPNPEALLANASDPTNFHWPRISFFFELVYMFSNRGLFAAIYTTSPGFTLIDRHNKNYLAIGTVKLERLDISYFAALMAPAIFPFIHNKTPASIY